MKKTTVLLISVIALLSGIVFGRQGSNHVMRIVDTLEVRQNGYQLYNVDIIEVDGQQFLANSQGGVCPLNPK